MASEEISIFKDSDIYLARLQKMCDDVIPKALLMLLKWLNPRWKPPTSFEHFLKTENPCVIDEFYKSLDEHQKALLTKDPLGDAYDASLLYILIQMGGGDLAPKGDPRWFKQSECPGLELLITSVKNVRNDIMHPYQEIVQTEFFEKTEKIRQCIKKMFMCASNKYDYITKTEVGQALDDLNDIINRIRDDQINPKNFPDLINQPVFQEQREFVKNEGTKLLQTLHKSYSILTPLCNLAKVSFPVNEVFTDMVMKGECKGKQNLELHYLLEKDDHCNMNTIIFIEGEPGVGKTTLVKKILSDWSNERPSMKYLDTYDLVLHTECRDHIGSFKEMIHASIKNVAKRFCGNDLMYVILSLRCLLIIDGFDELNKISANLFNEIMEIKSTFDITVIVTSRPEGITKYYECAKSYKLETMHIQLIGIPPEKRERFVRRYYSGIENINQNCPDIDGLLMYLKRTEYRLSDVWRLPYNLTILTILWTIWPDVINCITTAPELHWEMHQLYLSKLKERLLSNKDTKHLSASNLEKKVNIFIYSLCKVSLVGLANDDVTLPGTVYNQLEDVCKEAQIPVKEMVGAFLKRTTSNSGVKYSYPHKGLQDFLAALFLFTKLTAAPLSSKFEKAIIAIDRALNKHNVPIQVSQNIKSLSKAQLRHADYLKSTEEIQAFDEEKIAKDTDSILSVNNVPEDLSNDIARIICEKINKHILESSSGLAMQDASIENIISKIINSSGLPSLSKFQNMFTVLIGLFYQDSTGAIKEVTKLEALELLRQTGISDKNAWIRILNSVKCDEFVATYISKEIQIFSSHIGITDSNIFAYISILKAMKPPLPNVHEINMTLNIKGDLSGVSELLSLVSFHELMLNYVWVYDGNFREYTEILRDLAVPLKNSENIKFRITLKEDLPRVCTLLGNIKRHNFSLHTLNLSSHKLVIDRYYDDFLIILRSLPTAQPRVHGIKVFLHIKEQIPITLFEELLEQISRNQYALQLHMSQDFLYPSVASVPEDSLNKVFQECDVSIYTGPVTKGIKLPLDAEKLYVSIVNSEGYATLLQYLIDREGILFKLVVCMSPQLATSSQLLTPLPDMNLSLGLSVVIPNLKTKNDIHNSATLLKKIAPVTKKGFYQIFFPDANLGYGMLEELMNKLIGLEVEKSIEFPEANKPNTSENELHLQQLAKEATHCEKGIDWKGEDMTQWSEREITPTLMPYMF